MLTIQYDSTAEI